MLEIKNVEVYGINRAVNAISNSYTAGEINTAREMTEDDLRRARRQGSNCDGHQSHDGFLKGITVVFDIKYPLYWTPEFQRYHFADIIMSQSTMHSLDKFLSGDVDCFNKYVARETKNTVHKLYSELVAIQNTKIDKFGPEARELHAKSLYDAFMRLRSNLPCGFEMWETVTTNYLELKTIWTQRHNHKLREDWGEFCRVIEGLPCFKEFTGIGGAS